MKHSEETRKAILEAALDLFADGDFHKTRIREIAKRANIAPGTIYRYFPDKENLLFAVLETKANEVVLALRHELKGIEGTFNLIRKFIWYMCEVYNNRDKRMGVLFYIAVPLKSWMAGSFFRKSEWNQMLLDIFKAGQSKGDVRKDIDPVLMMDVVYSLLERSFQMSVLRQKPKDLTINVDMLTEIIFKAFRKESEIGYSFECPMLKEAVTRPLPEQPGAHV